MLLDNKVGKVTEKPIYKNQLYVYMLTAGNKIKVKNAIYNRHQKIGN